MRCVILSEMAHLLYQKPKITNYLIMKETKERNIKIENGHTPQECECHKNKYSEAMTEEAAEAKADGKNCKDNCEACSSHETTQEDKEEDELNEIVQLVGVDGLSKEDQLKLEVCKMIREDYLHQNAFHEVDTFTSTNKQFKLLDLILRYYDEGLMGLHEHADFKAITSLPLREDIGRFKYLEEDEVDREYAALVGKLEASIEELIKKAGEMND